MTPTQSDEDKKFLAYLACYVANMVAVSIENSTVTDTTYWCDYATEERIKMRAEELVQEFNKPKQAEGGE